MDWSKARWPIVLGLVLVAIAIEVVRSGAGSVSVPIPDNLAAADPEVAQLIRDSVANVEREPTSLAHWVTLGKVYEANAFHDVAIQSYQHVLDADPNQSQVWFRYGVCQERTGNLDAAIEAMEKVIDLAPKFSPARWRQSLWLSDVGQYDKAAQRAEEAVELDSEGSSGWFAKVRALLGQRKNEEALEIIRTQELESASNAEYARYLIGTAYRQMGQLDKAQGYLSSSQNTRPVWRDEWTRELSNFHKGLAKQRAVASNLVRRGQFQEAIPVLEEAVAADPSEPRTLNLLGMSYLQTRQFDRSFEILEKSLAQHPEHFSSNVNFAAAVILAKQVGEDVDLELGLQRATKAAQLRPDAANAHEAQAQIFKFLKRWQESIDAFDRALQIGLASPESWH